MFYLLWLFKRKKKNQLETSIKFPRTLPAMPRGKRSKAQQQEEEDSSSSSSASSSSAESIELDLGEDGRINVPGLVVKPFRSFSSAIAESTEIY